MPSGISAGNLLLTSLMLDAGSSLSITPPSGWTLYTRADNGTGSFLCAIFYRVADGSESGSYSYTLGSSVVGSAQTIRITGHDATWEDATPTQNTGLSESMGYYGVTTNTANALAIAYVGVDSTSNVPTTPSGFTSESSGNGSSRGWRISSLVVVAPGWIGNSYVSTQGSTRHWATIMIAIKPGAGGTQHNQSVAGTLTSAGAITRRAAKLPAGALTSAGAITKRTASAKAGSLTTSGVAIKRTASTKAGTLTSAGTVARRAGKSTAGTLTSSGTATRRTSKGVAGTLSSSGALSAIRTVLMAIAGVLGLSGTATKRTATTKAGTLTSAGAATKQTRREVAGTLSPSATLNSIRTFLRTVAGTLGMSGDATKQTRSTKAGVLTSAGNITKQTHTITSGVLGSSGALARARTAVLALAGVLSMSGAAMKQTNTSTGGVLASSGSITKRISRTVAGVLGMLGDAIGALLAGNRVSTDLVMRDEPDLIMRDEPALTVASELPLRMR
jgi:hypothetical protein